MASNIETTVRNEVESLHEFFVDWFSGTLPASDFETGFLARFDPQFLLIPPGGELLTLSDLASRIRRGHGNNPDFRIQIRNVKVRRMTGREILATYEEWQRNALASTPQDNARMATVLFEHGDPLRWLHVHETWMPEPVASAGPYDF